MGLGMTWFEFDCPPKTKSGFFILPLFIESLAEIVVGICKVGTRLQGAAIAFHCFARLTQLHEQVAEVVMGFYKSRF